MALLFCLVIGFGIAGLISGNKEFERIGGYILAIGVGIGLVLLIS